MKTSEQTDQLIKALTSFQKALEPISKSKTVKTGKYEFKYAPLDAIMAHIKPLMTANQLAFVQCLDEQSLVTRLMHESGQWIESSTYLNRDHVNMQGFGGEVTYKRRYSLCSLLGIVSDEDDDVPRISATQGSMDVLPSKRQSFIADVAEIIKDKHSDNNEWGAYEEYVQITDQDERVALWSLLPSKVRTTLTKLNKEEREKA